MRLTEIKLAGFKSFVDPVTIATPGQLVGIVGPNGCGKSNVIDAVRWVLGESKASALRGESMQDVIFNGAGERAPVGRAAVELLFDNSQGRVGGQWGRYTELSINRVLSRDGDSTYYINNIPVRRRDIHTKDRFGDFQLHVEFATPAEVRGRGQGRGNSGVFLADRYEIQILDSYDNKTYFDGQCGAIYKQQPPTVNACRKPGEWQTYDILFTAPRPPARRRSFGHRSTALSRPSAADTWTIVPDDESCDAGRSAEIERPAIAGCP